MLILISFYLSGESMTLRRLASNSLYSSSEIILVAIIRVLKPILENSSNWLSIKGRYNYSTFVARRALTILSAPLIKSFITPSSLIITLILFLSLSNSNKLRSSTFLSLPYIANVCSLAEAPTNLYPIRAAASTNVISSGEGPW